MYLLHLILSGARLPGVVATEGCWVRCRDRSPASWSSFAVSAQWCIERYGHCHQAAAAGMGAVCTRDEPQTALECRAPKASSISNHNGPSASARSGWEAANGTASHAGPGPSTSHGLATPSCLQEAACSTSGFHGAFDSSCSSSAAQQVGFCMRHFE